MQDNPIWKNKIIIFKLIEETKELNEEEFEQILIQVFKSKNNSFPSEIKERLVIDIAKMRKN